MVDTTNVYEMADTWNDGATVFTAVKMNVTDSASNSASLLMDLQVGSTSKFKVDKNGKVSITGISSGAAIIESLTQFRAGAIAIGQDTGAGAGAAFGPSSASFTAAAGANGFLIGSSGYFAWSPSTIASQPDTRLYRDAADTLALRRDTNPQEFRLYNTYSDASNYERLEVKYASNYATIESVASGTGTRRSLQLKAGGGSFEISNFLVTCNNILDMNNNVFKGPSYMQMTERPSAPSAGGATDVRVYAEDDGAGKTRLMALFGTGAAQQIAIEP